VAQEQNAILELTVNQVAKEPIFVILRPQDVLVTLADLEKAGLQNFAGSRETINNETYVSLVSLAPQVSYIFDEKALTLKITAQPELLKTNSFNLGRQSPKNITYNQDTSVFFNYAFNLPVDIEKFNLKNNNYTFFGESGLSINKSLLYSSFSRKTDGSWLRGLTNFTLDNPRQITKWVVGDSFVSTGDLGGGMFMAGVSKSRDFRLNPDVIQQPTFSLSGAALTPSKVEVFVNGQRVNQIEVPPGRFQFDNLLLPTGSGSTKVVIRDALGREQVITSPFYFAPGLLKPGLSDYSFNLGLQRFKLDFDNFNYGSLAFLGRYRQGITNSLTLGGRLEVANNLISGGSSLTTTLPFGALGLSLAASSESGIPGAAAALTYSYSRRNIGFGGSVRVLSDRYANLSLTALNDRAKLENNAFVSVSPTRNFSLGLQYASSDFRDKGHINRLALTSSLRLNSRANLSINLTQSNQSRQPTKNELFLGFNYTLGNARANISRQNTNGKTAINSTISVQKSPPAGNGLGYRLQVNPNGEKIPANGSIQYRAPFGVYELNLNRSNGKNSGSVNVSGSIIGIGNSVFLAPPVTQSFALIQVPGVEGVRGYSNNQEVGRTGSRGNLIITNLRPYNGNNLKIQDEDIPLNYKIDANEKVITPPFRGGAVVRFPVRLIQSLVGTLSVETSGKTVIPSYGQLNITVNNQIINLPIGKEGDFYLDSVAPGKYAANVDYEGGICNFELTIPQSQEQMVNLGNLKCIIP
jgi:outer membrane usher protein